MARLPQQKQQSSLAVESRLPNLSAQNLSNSGSSLTQWLHNLKVGQKIGFGYAVSLSIAILGTGIGILIGHSYHNEAEKAIEDALVEIKLLDNMRHNLTQTQLHHKRLAAFVENPLLFALEMDGFRKNGEEFKQSWSRFKAFYQNSEEGEEGEAEIDQVKVLQQDYDGVFTVYIAETEAILTSLSLSQLSPSEVALIRQQLVDLYNSSTVLNLLEFANHLDEALTFFTLDEEQEIEAALTRAKNLQTQVIIVSMLVSSLIAIILAIYISRTISYPLYTVTRVAHQTTQDSNFNLQVPVTTKDEVGVLATAFNLLIQRAKELLKEKEARAIELQQINDKLKATQQQMIAQEKMASLGSLTAGIAHEIRNPLNFVNNFAELSVDLTQELLEELEEQQENLDPELVEDLTDIINDLSTNANKINHHGKRAEKIVSSMLLHSRGSEGDWEATDINRLLAEAVNLAYHGMRAQDSTFNVTFDTDYDDTIGKFKLIPQDINRVFLNIVGNACYAVHQKKQIIESDFTPLIKISSKNLGDQVEIKIRDNGYGMTRDVINKIFDHFFTTKPTGEGTGLGLSLSYEIITQEHQGELRVESEPDIYAEFIIILPRKND